MKLLKNIQLYKRVKDYTQYHIPYNNGFVKTRRHPLAYKVARAELTSIRAIDRLSAYIKFNL